MDSNKMFISLLEKKGYKYSISPEGVFTVKEDIFLSGYEELTSLPEKLVIKGWADFSGCISLAHLPKGLVVENWFNLRSCISLRHLPKGLVVGGHLWIDECTLYQFPQDLKVGGKIYGDYKIISNTERFITED